ncbi:uncharacterized protein IL334_000764 [Kwoniella shivajii]|uniref:Ubiquitin-like domain-containing protein n=1 Tax=Kwoniella shivajii TaxID=564305 RepID=A0ABZ1CR32_9TREE|nr:hypothetical protein IL334_000764 [Kwoniella shivajii]
MMIFVGTEYPGGKQFHVWIQENSTTEDLMNAISEHETIPINTFILQHSFLPLIPSSTLNSQFIIPYSTVHLYRLNDLRAKDRLRREAQRSEAEERGRYTAKDGKDRLRRRTRQKLEAHRAEKELERRGNGLLPSYQQLERVSKEHQDQDQNSLVKLENPLWITNRAEIDTGKTIGEESLLTSTPLERGVTISSWASSSAPSPSATNRANTTKQAATSPVIDPLTSVPSPIGGSVQLRGSTPILPQYPFSPPLSSLCDQTQRN